MQVFWKNNGTYGTELATIMTAVSLSEPLSVLPGLEYLEGF